MRRAPVSVLFSLIAACGSSSSSDGGGVQYEKPQIVPDNNPVCLSNKRVAVGESITQPVLFVNDGRDPLMITSATIANDLRHAFTFRGPDTMTVESRGFATIELRYDPPAPGWDNVQLRVMSNAENYPRLDIYVLARAEPPGLDGGVYDAGPKPAEAQNACERGDSGP